MLSDLLARLGFSSGGDTPTTDRLMPFGWGMRGQLRGSSANGIRRTITDYRDPNPIAVGTLQAIETNNGRLQVPGQPTQRFGMPSATNGKRAMGYFDAGQRFVGSSLLTSAAAPARNLRPGLPAAQPLSGQPISKMTALLLDSTGWDTTATGVIGGTSVGTF